MRATAFALVVMTLLGTPCAAASAQATDDSRAGSAKGISQLGRLMFFDPALSASGKLACATCHDPRYAYGPPPGKALAVGGKHMNLPGTRAVPSLRYLHGAPAFAEEHHFIDGDVGPVGGFTWDGRAASLHEQAVAPLLSVNEMANESPESVARKLARAPYAGLFKSVFGADAFADPRRAFEEGLRALEAFQQEPAEFYPYTSKYDAFLRGEVELTDAEERGVALFKDPAKGNCASCHLGASRAGAPPPFTDFDFANVGVPRNPRIAANADPHYFDLGLCGPLRTDLTAKPQYCGLFRSPTLRNSALRDAFFHNGVFTSLREVMQFYVERDLHPERFYSRNPDGSVHPFDDLPAGLPFNIDRDAPLDRPPGAAPALTDAEIDDVIAFLGTLTDGYTAAPVQTAAALSQPPARTLDWSRPWAPPHLDAAAVRGHSDEYAWRLFVALNWPTDPVTRRPNPDASLGATAPVVWESWANAEDVYRKDGADPGPWTRVARQPAQATAARFELGRLQGRPHLRHVVGGVMVPFEEPLEHARRLTEIRMNRTAFDYVRARDLYNLDGQMRSVARDGPIRFPPQAAQIKAAWRPIDSTQRSRYYTVEVVLRDGTKRLYGLTALNLVSKDLPQWFWAAFEHVDNAVRADSAGWQLPSRDGFACPPPQLDCNAVPAGVGLEGTPWSYYRLRGTLTSYVTADGQPTVLANSELESVAQSSSSCMTCHARAALAVVAGNAVRLEAAPGQVGRPAASWFEGFQRQDFVWSLAKAQPVRQSR